MASSSMLRLFSFTTLLALAAADTNYTTQGNPNSVCFSYGVDFVDEGSYFIDTASKDNFTCISTFNGCNADNAEVLFIGPTGDEVFCSQIPTLPDNTNQISSCPVSKSSMVSGDYMILVLGNNGNGQPYAWQRDLHLQCGLQVTTTVTPTVTYTLNTTPTVVLNSTLTSVATLTQSPTTTYVKPSTTGQDVTVTPSDVIRDVTKTVSRYRLTVHHALTVTTTTKTAGCSTISTIKQDKPCTYSPTLVHPAALATPTSITDAQKSRRFIRKADRAVNVEYVRARMAAAKARRGSSNSTAAVVPILKMGPDQATITITAATPVNATLTSTAPATTRTDITTTTTTVVTSLAPSTLLSGVYVKTITLPASTKTSSHVVTTTIQTIRTIPATYTRTKTVTPSMGVAACTAVNSQDNWWDDDNCNFEGSGRR